MGQLSLVDLPRTLKECISQRGSLIKGFLFFKESVGKDLVTYFINHFQLNFIAKYNTNTENCITQNYNLLT